MLNVAILDSLFKSVGFILLSIFKLEMTPYINIDITSLKILEL